MAQDLTAAQSDWISNFRKSASQVFQVTQQLLYLQSMATEPILGTPDNFVTGAFAGNNSDLTPAILDNALTQLATLQAQFYVAGVPTALTIALMQVAPVGLP
jgi:hypothetical protein